jgi:cyanophycin synthetase
MIYLTIILLIIALIFYLINLLLRKKFIENYTGIISDNFYKEAENNNFILNKDEKTIKYCINEKCETKSYNKHFNSDGAIKLAKDKFSTSSKLEKHNIPIPRFLKINLEKESTDDVINNMQIKNINFPVVIKPIYGTFGIDVVTDIESYDELNGYLNIYREKYPDLLLEEQIEGDCYRIFVFNNKILDVIKREKPYITGNGKNKIRELINIRNEEQKKMKLFPTNNVGDLLLKKQGYTKDHVLENGKKIYISNVINMHNGARISRVEIDSIPEKNKKIFLKTNEALEINCSGLDYLSNDISIDYNKNNSKILEVNGTPDTEIHDLVKFEKGDDSFFKRLVNSIF